MYGKQLKYCMVNTKKLVLLQKKKRKERKKYLLNQSKINKKHLPTGLFRAYNMAIKKRIYASK